MTNATSGCDRRPFGATVGVSPVGAMVNSLGWKPQASFTSQVFFTLALILVLAAPLALLAGEPPLPVGVAAIDITPSYAVRLSGYGSRRTESGGVALRIYAKAVAIGDELVLTVDNLGVPETISAEIAKRLQTPRERLAVCSSHTHCARCWRMWRRPFSACRFRRNIRKTSIVILTN